MRRSPQNQVLGIVLVGFVTFWRGQPIRSVGGAIHYFRTEWDAWMFLWLCDAVDGVPAVVRVNSAGV